jgi:hypothetical protein
MKRCSLLLATVGLVMGAIAGPTRPAQAFGLSFTPTGTPDAPYQLPHLNVTSSSVIFELFFEGSGLLDSDLVNEITVYMEFDSTELSDPMYPGAIVVDPIHDGLGMKYKGLKYSGLNIVGGSASPTPFGRISFTPNPDGLTANNELDFNLNLTGVSGSRTNSLSPFSFFYFDFKSGDVTKVNGLGQAFQSVEVQGAARAVPTPALLPGLVSFGFGLVRKRKQEWVG